MPETAKESKAAPPAFDPHSILDKLKGIARDHQKKDGGSKSWVGTLVIIATVIVGAIAWWFLAGRSGRELAKLRHEKNKAKILKEKAEADAKVAANNKEIELAGYALELSRDRLRVIESDIKAEEARHEANLRAIDSIRSWRDAGIR